MLTNSLDVIVARYQATQIEEKVWRDALQNRI
jgi:hypothetical protein